MDWILIRWRWGAVARVVLGAVWVLTSWSKLSDPHQFMRAVASYDATPSWLTKAISYGLPMLGLCLAILLILGVLTRYAAAASGVVLIAILIGLFQAWARGLNNTSSFISGAGLTEHPRYPLTILITLIALAISVELAIWPITELSIDDRLVRAGEVPEASVRQLRTARGQQRYQAQVDKRRRQARNEQLFLGGSVAVVVVLICLIGMSVQSTRAYQGVSTSATNATIAGGIAWGDKNAPVAVDIYEDFSCDECQQFEQAAGADLWTAVYAGKVRINFHPMAYVDPGKNGYSLLAANAAVCASDISADTFVAFHNVAFGVATDTGGTPAPTATPSGTDTASAPTDSATPAPSDTTTAAGSGTPTDATVPSSGASSSAPDADTGDAALTTTDKLTALGTEANISDASFNTCVTGDTHKDLVQAMTDRAIKDGVSDAPAVFVGGDKLSFSSADDLHTKLVAAIDKGVDTATSAGKKLAPYTPAPTDTASSSADDGTGDDTGDDGTVPTDGSVPTDDLTALPS